MYYVASKDKLQDNIENQEHKPHGSRSVTIGACFLGVVLSCGEVSDLVGVSGLWKKEEVKNST